MWEGMRERERGGGGRREEFVTKFTVVRGGECVGGKGRERRSVSPN